jgi:hypothetical protein
VQGGSLRAFVAPSTQRSSPDPSEHSGWVDPSACARNVLVVRVFISSTKTGLEDERQAVHDALVANGHEPVWMEDFGSRGEDALETCLRELETCDVVVVIIGHWYGTIAQRLGLSYTEAEYERAEDPDVEVRVHAYVKEGFDAALDQADHPLRLRDFRDLVEDAHTVRRPYFASADALAEHVVEDLRRLEIEPRRNRPRFGHIRRAVRNPSQYAIGDLRRTRLQMYPFRIGLVDLAVLDQPAYEEVGSRRLRDKVLEVRDEMAERGANIFVFNEISGAGAETEAVVAYRLQELKAQADEIVCFVRGRSDAESVPQLADAAHKMSLWYPERIDVIHITGLEHAWRYTNRELKDCSLAKRVIDYLNEKVSEHLVDSLRHGE